MSKTANPAALDSAGRAKLAELASFELLYHIDYAAELQGEPVELPAAFYKAEPSPSGYSVLGWRLTAEGIAAWHAQKGRPAPDRH